MKACGSKTDQLFNDLWEFQVYVGDNKKTEYKTWSASRFEQQTIDDCECRLHINSFCKKLKVLLL